MISEPPAAPSSAPQKSQEQWTHVTLKRGTKKLVVHTTETIDGVLFVSQQHFDAAGQLEAKQLVRADLVRG
jgi:hypothetical protein